MGKKVNNELNLLGHSDAEVLIMNVFSKQVLSDPVNMDKFMADPKREKEEDRGKVIVELKVGGFEVDPKIFINELVETINHAIEAKNQRMVDKERRLEKLREDIKKEGLKKVMSWTMDLQFVVGEAVMKKLIEDEEDRDDR
jgi:hypothetical protein